MKKLLCITVLIAALPLGISAGKLGSVGATLNVTITASTSGDPVYVVGSGYWAGKGVYIVVQGPTPLTVHSTADSQGNIDVDLGPPGLPGYYNVSTYQLSGHRWVFMATSGFEV